MHPKEQVVGCDATDVSAERMPHAGSPGDGNTRVAQKGQELCNTSGNGSEVVDGGRVAREGSQLTPVDDEHIVTSVLGVGC